MHGPHHDELLPLDEDIWPRVQQIHDSCSVETKFPVEIIRFCVFVPPMKIRWEQLTARPLSEGAISQNLFVLEWSRPDHKDKQTKAKSKGRPPLMSYIDLGQPIHRPICYGIQPMIDAANYSVVETLRDGRTIEIRALRSEDRAGLESAVDRTSAQSLYRRFFGVRRNFTEKEVAFFVNVDFKKHVALVATVKEKDHNVIVAGGRYILERTGTAEVAFAVIDEYQGKGLGSLLLNHLAIIARDSGLTAFTADVLADNIPMLKVFEKSGLKFNAKPDANVVHLTLSL